MKKHSLGFTLIELLVVISIIGTLSSIVLSSLGTARNKGADAAIKQDFAQIPAAVENGHVDVPLPGAAITYEYGWTCNPTSASGKLFADAASHTDHSLTAARCVTNTEPFDLTYTLGNAATYEFNSSGVLTKTGHSPWPPFTKTSWAMSVELTDGSYECISDKQGVATTSTLSIGVTDTTC